MSVYRHAGRAKKAAAKQQRRLEGQQQLTQQEELTQVAEEGIATSSPTDLGASGEELDDIMETLARGFVDTDDASPMTESLSTHLLASTMAE